MPRNRSQKTNKPESADKSSGFLRLSEDFSRGKDVPIVIGCLGKILPASTYGRQIGQPIVILQSPLAWASDLG